MGGGVLMGVPPTPLSFSLSPRPLVTLPPLATTHNNHSYQPLPNAPCDMPYLVPMLIGPFSHATTDVQPRCHPLTNTDIAQASRSRFGSKIGS